MGNCRLSGLYKQSIIVFLSTLHSLFYKIHHSISIHAPRGGSDVCTRLCTIYKNLYFYPRSPWGERHQGYRDGLAQGRKFLSTLPVGGATGWRCKNSLSVWHFYPRSPWGERPGRMKHTMSFAKFLSTLPVGGATYITYDTRYYAIDISIHAPRGGSDSKHDNIPFIFATVYYAI